MAVTVVLMLVLAVLLLRLLRLLRLLLLPLLLPLLQLLCCAAALPSTANVADRAGLLIFLCCSCDGGAVNHFCSGGSNGGTTAALHWLTSVNVDWLAAMVGQPYVPRLIGWS